MPENTKRTIFKNASTTYYYSSKFFSKKSWDMVATIYAYVRTADDFVDSYPQDRTGFADFVSETKSYLALRAKETKRIKNSKIFLNDSAPTQHSVVIREFVELVISKKIPVRWVTAFLQAMVSDFQTDGWIIYENRNKLSEYIYGSAEVIGLMMCKVLDISSNGYAAARKQGESMQMINFIRDIAEDCSMKRQYLPSSALKKHGVKNLCIVPRTPEEVKKFTSFMRSEIDKYLILQKEAEAGYKYLPFRYRVPIATAARLYVWTAQKIYADPMIVYSTKVKPTKLQVLGTLAQVSLQSMW